jgi:hypothetical protein
MARAPVLTDRDFSTIGQAGIQHYYRSRSFHAIAMLLQ